MKATVLDGYTTNPGDNSWAPLEAQCQLQVFDRTPPDRVVERCADSPIVVTNKTVLSAETIGQLPNLKFIAMLATGYDVVDTLAARQRGIPVSNAPGYSQDSVAQHVFAMILARLHQPEEHHRRVQAGQWESSDDYCFWVGQPAELADKTLGIVGYGQIGRRVAEIGAAFRMNVLACNPRLAGKIRLDYERFDYCTLDQVFRESDFVSLHCPLTGETAGMVDTRRLAMMKPTAVLINTARGGLVKEQDLADALNREQIAGACVDVVSVEPIGGDNPLLTARHCMITPHNAWATLESRRRLVRITAENVEAFLGGRPIHVVN